VTVLDEACADLTAWLPHAAALITQPDTDGHPGHTKPGSNPPWNSAVANALLDTHAGVRELEQNLRYAVTGRIMVRGGSDTNTIRAIEAVGRLAEAVDQALADDAARQLNSFITGILQLRAIDLEEVPRILLCPRCDREMLRVWEATGRVACFGCMIGGWMMPGTVSTGYVQWEDGEIS